MKKVLLTVLIITVFIMSGCSASKPTKKTILKDLSMQSDIINYASDLFEIKECEIVKSTYEDEKTIIYECELTKEGERYRVISVCMATYCYYKDGGWLFKKCNEEIKKVSPISEVSNSLVEYAIRKMVSGNKDDTEIINIIHNFDEKNESDKITADFSCKQKFKTKSGSITINAFFKDDSWDLSSCSENSTESWDMQSLIGIWQLQIGSVILQYKIDSIDEATSTVVYSSRTANTGAFAVDSADVKKDKRNKAINEINNKPFSETKCSTYKLWDKGKFEDVGPDSFKEGEHIELFYDEINEESLNVSPNMVYNTDGFYGWLRRAEKIM